MPTTVGGGEWIWLTGSQAAYFGGREFNWEKHWTLGWPKHGRFPCAAKSPETAQSEWHSHLLTSDPRRRHTTPGLVNSRAIPTVPLEGSSRATLFWKLFSSSPDIPLTFSSASFSQPCIYSHKIVINPPHPSVMLFYNYLEYVILTTFGWPYIITSRTISPLFRHICQGPTICISHTFLLIIILGKPLSVFSFAGYVFLTGLQFSCPMTPGSSGTQPGFCSLSGSLAEYTCPISWLPSIPWLLSFL